LPGILGLPHPRELGGAGWTFVGYLEAIEVLASGWLTIAESVAVHTLACYRRLLRSAGLGIQICTSAH
jgi:alkylation response protein AidB-like acyl-CoA dehydrogenase